jgi:hypothetical protein
MFFNLFSFLFNKRDEVLTEYSLLEVAMDPSTDHRRFPLYDEYQSCTNSHDSLLQPVYTEESSTDDLTKLNPFFPSTFHSKDSALDLSEENIPQLTSESPPSSSSTTEQTSKSFFHSFITHLDNVCRSVLIGLSTNPVRVYILFEKFILLV